MDQLAHDFRLALRNLGRRRGTSVTIVLTLAVGIACTTAMFGVVRGMLLRPLPWEDVDRLAVVTSVPPQSVDELELSAPEILDLQELLEGVEVGTYRGGSATVMFEDRTESYVQRRLTPEVFDFLGILPVLGRGFVDEDFETSADRVLLSHELWQRVFGSDREVIGRKLEIDGRQAEIIGVTPPNVSLPRDIVDGQRPQLFSPISLDRYESWPRQTRMFAGLARLRHGVSFESGQAELDRAMEELRRRHPNQYEAGWRLRLTPVEEEVLGEVRPAVLLLFGAVFFVLMIACANVANLLLAQNDRRSDELALRRALGAPRGRLVRQLMAENLVQALAACAIGTFGAFWAVETLLRLQPGNLPRIHSVAVDGQVLLFGLVASTLTVLAFGLIPALNATSPRMRSAMHRGRGAVDGLRGTRGRQMLMVAEVALATVLLAGSGLLVESMRQLVSADLGFEPERLSAASVALPRSYDRSEVPLFWYQLRQAAEELPGVEKASLVTMLPFYSGIMSREFEVEDADRGTRTVPRVSIDRAGPGVVETLGLPLSKGRDLTEQDREGTPLVALVNETLARYLGDEALGQRLRLAVPDNPDDTFSPPWVTVVGVVADMPHGDVEETVAPRVFLPYTQLPEIAGWRVPTFMWLALRTREGVEPGFDGVRAALREIDPSVAFSKTLVMEDHISGSVLARYRFSAFVLGLFAATALGLALVGIYALLSYRVHSGRREVGVRMAVGARRRDIHRLVNRQGLALVLAGLALGLPAALGLTGLLESLLYDVAPSDPRAFGVAGGLMLLVAFAASHLPARRATEVNPIDVLRGD
ncbi:MAG: ABC transporter permease [Holophagales bacterium]|nr:ABC transporter permease [Holophagales bacterium]